MTETAIILAGGFGTRLQPVINQLPKPMAPVNGQPFLNYQLRYLKHFGVKNVILSVGYLHTKLMDHYQSEFEGLNISYVIEERPLGTGGGIRLAMAQCGSALVLALNGDSFFDMDLDSFSRLHLHGKSAISLALRKVQSASRYGTIVTDATHSVVSFQEKNNLAEAGTINAGVYLMDRETFLANTPAVTPFSIEKDFFEKQLEHLRIKGFEFEGYFIDIGLPDDYLKAQNDFKDFKYR